MWSFSVLFSRLNWELHDECGAESGSGSCVQFTLQAEMFTLVWYSKTLYIKLLTQKSFYLVSLYISLRLCFAALFSIKYSL